MMNEKEKSMMTARLFLVCVCACMEGGGFASVLFSFPPLVLFCFFD